MAKRQAGGAAPRAQPGPDRRHRARTARQAASTPSACGGWPRQLGTGPASLYAHVSNKEELHELMLDRLLGRLPRPKPDPGRWTEQILAMAKAQLEMLTSYPGIARVGLETIMPAGPNALAYGEAVLAVFRAGGLPDRDRGVRVRHRLVVVRGVRVRGQRGVRPGEVDPESFAGAGKEIVAYMAARPDQFPNLLSVGPVPARPLWNNGSSSRSTCSWQV